MDDIANQKPKRLTGQGRIAQFRAKIEREYGQDNPDYDFIARAEFTIARIESGMDRKHGIGPQETMRSGAKAHGPQKSATEAEIRIQQLLKRVDQHRTTSQYLIARTKQYQATADYMTLVTKLLIPLVPKHAVSQVLQTAKQNLDRKEGIYVSSQAQPGYHQKPSALQESSRSAGGSRAFCRTAQA